MMKTYTLQKSESTHIHPDSKNMPMHKSTRLTIQVELDKPTVQKPQQSKKVKDKKKAPPYIQPHLPHPSCIYCLDSIWDKGLLVDVSLCHRSSVTFP